MKWLCVIISFIAFNPPVFAGSASCTNSTTITVPTDTGVSDPTCIIRAELPLASFGFVRYYLPASPYIGQEFTLQENSDTLNDSGSYWDDDLQDWVYYSYDYTGGTAFEVPNPETYQINFFNIAMTNEITNFTKGGYMKVVFDGTQWIYSGGTF